MDFGVVEDAAFDAEPTLEVEVYGGDVGEVEGVGGEEAFWEVVWVCAVEVVAVDVVSGGAWGGVAAVACGLSEVPAAGGRPSWVGVVYEELVDLGWAVEGFKGVGGAGVVVD